MPNGESAHGQNDQCAARVAPENTFLANEMLEISPSRLLTRSSISAIVPIAREPRFRFSQYL
jgi:hypothetical protein